MDLRPAGSPLRHRGRARHIRAHVLLQLAAVFHVCGAVRVIIDDFSPRTVYNTPVLPESTCKLQRGNATCNQHWWYEHGDSRGADSNDTVHTTWGPGTVATLEFRGPSVSLYGIQLVQFGAQAIVTLNNEPPVRIDSNITALPNGATLRTQQLLYSKSELNPSSSHKISVAYDDSAFDPTNPAWLSIDYFEVDESPQSPGSTTTSGASSGSPTTATDSVTAIPPPAEGGPIASPEQSTVQAPITATKSQKDNIGLIVGAVLGAVAGVLLVALLAVSTRRRRRRRERAPRSGLAGQLLSPLVTVAADSTAILETSSATFFPQVTSYAPSSVSDSVSEQQRRIALSPPPPPYSRSLVIDLEQGTGKG